MPDVLSIVASIVVTILVSAFVLQKSQRLAILIVLSMFLTRPVVSLGGFNVRIEIFVGGLSAIALIIGSLSGRETASLSKSARWSIALCIMWFVCTAVSTAAFAPNAVKSYSVLVWCVLNAISALWVAKHPSMWRQMLRAGTTISLINVILAIAAWAAASAGISQLGVQVDPAYGGYAAFVTSLEANILAGVLCLWGIVAAYNPWGCIRRPIRLLLVLLTPIAIIATHTRASLVAYVVGLVIVFLVRRSSRTLVGWASAVGGSAVLYLLSNTQGQGLGKFASLFDVSTGTGGLRFQVNSVALVEWWNSPGKLIGLGWNSFGQRHTDLTQPGLGIPGYIGNLPLQIVYDGGIVSALLVLLAASLIFAQAIYRKKLGAFLALAIPYLFFSIATSALWFLETWIFVGFAWGYISNPSSLGAPGERQTWSIPLDDRAPDRAVS